MSFAMITGKPKYGEEGKLFIMDTNKVLSPWKQKILIETLQRTRFDTFNYELVRPLCIGKNKIIIGLMANELRKKMRQLEGT